MIYLTTLSLLDVYIVSNYKEYQDTNLQIIDE